MQQHNDDEMQMTPGAVTVTLNNEVPMPRLGLGTYEIDQGGEVEQSIAWALDCGYRSIDTASAYGNETGVGEGIIQSLVPRDQIFLTSKVWNNEQGYEETLQACERTLKRLQTAYLDLYLVHWPIPEKMEQTWKAMEELHKSGRARAIGVCNFLIHHLEQLLRTAQISPAVNQVEIHPYLQQQQLREFCRDHGIQVEAWSPLMKGQVTEIPELQEIGEVYDKSPAQVAIRWELQSGLVTIPKSVHRNRIEENRDIFDFALTDGEMQTIAALDRGERVGPHPDEFTA